MATQARPIGEMLLKQGVITPEALKHALMEQERVADPVGEILARRGKLRYLDLYRCLARQQHLPFADLLAEPPQPGLTESARWQEYIRLRCLPWKREGAVTTLACCEVTPEMRAYAQEAFGENVRFALTSPLDIERGVEIACGRELDARARLHLFRSDPVASARTPPRPKAVLALVAFVSSLLAGGIFFPGIFVPALLVLCNSFYLLTILFKCLLFMASLHYRWIPASRLRQAAADTSGLPVYTLLIPIYREAECVPRILAAIDRLDYPASRLDVKLIVEADDTETLAAVRKARPGAKFDLVRVPYSLPRTKPKACNYALAFARGEFVTIYDAEDMPDPDQLRKAVATFRLAPPDVVCLQGRLNYYNRRENLLTGFFALEYSALFDFMIPGLAVFGIPIPLGGTSNHFRTEALRRLGEWDPYNVTEDADLGIRLALAGYRTWPLDSLTLEEAPVTVGSWIKQRARWIKGYVVTWRVAMRRAGMLWRRTGWKGFWGVQLFVGAASLVYMTAPVLWMLSAWWALGLAENGKEHVPHWVFAMAFSVFALGLFVQLGLALVIAWKRRWPEMALAVLLFPFYWFLHSFASMRAVWQLFSDPFHWDKTKHGVSRMLPKL